MTRTAVFRADASDRIGGGHVSRCLALAQVLKNFGWEIGFATRQETTVMLPQLVGQVDRMCVLDGSEADEVHHLHNHWPNGIDLLVCDHYARGEVFESAFGDWAVAVLACEDIPGRKHQADMILDPTPARVPSDYDTLTSEDTIRLTGPQYALIAQSFRFARLDNLERRSDSKRVERVLVSLGASDPQGATNTALLGIGESALDVDIDVVLGTDSTILRSAERVAGTLRQDVRFHIATDRMSELVAAADIAVGAGGVSALERCCLGLPTVMIVTAENQRDIATSLSGAGAIRLAGDAAGVNPRLISEMLQSLSKANIRQEMSRRAAAITDGLGPLRVILALAGETAAKDGTAVSLRPVTWDDRYRLLDWQQEPSTRKYFRNPMPPDEKEHFDWLKQCLTDSREILLVILHRSQPSGFLRLTRAISEDAEPIYEVSILSAPHHRRAGLGKAALRLVQRLLASGKLKAEVSPENAASRALFVGSGFEGDGEQFTYQAGS